MAIFFLRLFQVTFRFCWVLAYHKTPPPCLNNIENRAVTTTTTTMVASLLWATNAGVIFNSGRNVVALVIISIFTVSAHILPIATDDGVPTNTAQQCNCLFEARSTRCIVEAVVGVVIVVVARWCRWRNGKRKPGADERDTLRHKEGRLLNDTGRVDWNRCVANLLVSTPFI